MSETDDQLKWRFERSVQAFGGRHLDYASVYPGGMNTDVYTRPGWRWKYNDKHVFSVNDVGSRLSTRLRAIDLMMIGIYRCTTPECSYCEEE